MLFVAGCGQKGPLYLPREPAAANRATLPETLKPPLLDLQRSDEQRVNALDPANPGNAADAANSRPGARPITPAAPAIRGATP